MRIKYLKATYRTPVGTEVVTKSSAAVDYLVEQGVVEVIDADDDELPVEGKNINMTEAEVAESNKKIDAYTADETKNGKKKKKDEGK